MDFDHFLIALKEPMAIIASWLQNHLKFHSTERLQLLDKKRIGIASLTKKKRNLAFE
jgi:hypothetical protein